MRAKVIYKCTVKNYKKDHLQPLQTILHRIGPFVFILARSSARTHTPLQKLLRFEQNCYGLNTQFKAKKKKKKKFALELGVPGDKFIVLGQFFDLIEQGPEPKNFRQRASKVFKVL
jgi:hypothetical protein